MHIALRLATLFALLPVTCLDERAATASTPAPADPRAHLDTLLARYDRMPAGSAKDALAAEIDQVAHQKYATVSRLYWHTDFASAQAAARALGRPILHLRMLGRLDEDLSCANSRIFRTTLYASSGVSALLRDRFVLYWSSVRPAPRVTIDFGDGRKLERTVTGNSAHYVRDADGNVLDVLPGVYAPVAFRRELADSLALAEDVRGASAEVRAHKVVAYHEAKAAKDAAAHQPIAGGSVYLPNAREPRPPQVEPVFTAQRRARTKGAMEVPMLRAIEPDVPSATYDPSDVRQWAAAGRALYGLEAPAPTAELPAVLDARSRELVTRLHDALPAELRATPEAREAMLATLEQHLLADTAFNQFRLRPRISREIVHRGGRGTFASLDTWIYADVFSTPASDAWLGLLPRTHFTGLPGDGVVLP